MARKSKRFKITRKLALVSGLAVLIIASVGLGYWHYHNRPAQVVIPVAPAKKTTAAQNSVNSQSNGSSSGGSSTSSSSTPDKQAPSAGGYTPATTGQGTGSLTVSAGGLVSNHNPGSSTSTLETSVCSTTPGASCYIEFTLGAKVIKLQPGTADSNGTVYWNNWDVSDPSYGFSSGKWTITAVATLNGQTKTNQDSEDLTIQ